MPLAKKGTTHAEGRAMSALTSAGGTRGEGNTSMALKSESSNFSVPNTMMKGTVLSTVTALKTAAVAVAQQEQQHDPPQHTQPRRFKWPRSRGDTRALVEKTKQVFLLQMAVDTRKAGTFLTVSICHWNPSLY